MVTGSPNLHNTTFDTFESILRKLAISYLGGFVNLWYEPIVVLSMWNFNRNGWLVLWREYFAVKKIEINQPIRVVEQGNYHAFLQSTTW